jgi:hypothetical protein
LLVPTQGFFKAEGLKNLPRVEDLLDFNSVFVLQEDLFSLFVKKRDSPVRNFKVSEEIQVFCLEKFTNVESSSDTPDFETFRDT